MCGIAGIVSLQRSELPEKSTLAKMLSEIRYRGPDEINVSTIEGGFCGGSVRLAIEAISRGAQPVCNGRFTIGFNGEIFNYKSLR